MIRPILRHGAEVLHAPALPVASLTAGTQRLIDDMIETMHAAPGVGLAAPQVGVAERVFVIDLSLGARPGDLVVMVNPRFVARDGLQLADEGCLSVPGFTVTVARPRRVVVRALDRNGDEREVEGIGLLARALQHEMDHLEGRLYLDRLSRARRWILTKRIASMAREGRW
jgi:peptide deformylase